MLHFRSHETPNASILHPASRTRDMHTPFQDNLRCMGEKFPRNFLESKNLYRANSVSHRFIIPHKSQKKLKQKNRSVRHISPTSETTEGTIYFTFLLPFLYPFSSPLTHNHDLLNLFVTPTFASCGVSLLSHCNQRIHFPKHYASRSARRRHLITDHYPGESRVSRDPLCARDARACSTQGEGRVENRKKRKKWGGEKSKKRRRRREEKRTE